MTKDTTIVWNTSAMLRLWCVFYYRCSFYTWNTNKAARICFNWPPAGINFFFHFAIASGTGGLPARLVRAWLIHTCSFVLCALSLTTPCCVGVLIYVPYVLATDNISDISLLPNSTNLDDIILVSSFVLEHLPEKVCNFIISSSPHSSFSPPFFSWIWCLTITHSWLWPTGDKRFVAFPLYKQTMTLNVYGSVPQPVQEPNYSGTRVKTIFLVVKTSGHIVDFFIYNIIYIMAV